MSSTELHAAMDAGFAIGMFTGFYVSISVACVVSIVRHARRRASRGGGR